MAAGLDATSWQHEGSQPCSVMRMEEEEEEGRHCSHLHDSQPHRRESGGGGLPGEHRLPVPFLVAPAFVWQPGSTAVPGGITHAWTEGPGDT